MHVLLLGGQSPRHYDWVRELRTVLEEAGFPVVIHDYAHWLRGDSDIDFEGELRTVVALESEQKDDYIILGKSVGCVLALVGIGRGVLSPKACVFMGLPIESTNRYEESSAGLSDLPPTVFVQNEHDPFGAYEDVKAFARPYVPPTTLFVPLPGEDHEYTDCGLVTALTLKLAEHFGTK